MILDILTVLFFVLGFALILWMVGERRRRPRLSLSITAMCSLVSFDQSYHLAPLYSVKGVHNVAPIEHGKQTFHRSLRVPAVFPQDAPGVLNGANDRILVGIVHDGTPTPRNQDSRWGENFRSRLALRFYG